MLGNLKISFTTILTIFYALLFGLVSYGLVSLASRQSVASFQVDSTYIDGILTASSILFGFWAIMVERKPRQEKEKFLMYEAVIALFFFSLGMLMFSVVLIFLTAINSCPSVITLFFVSTSFIFNATFLAVILYYYEFKQVFSHK